MCFRKVEKNGEAQNRCDREKCIFEEMEYPKQKLKKLKEEGFEIVQKLSERDGENQKQA